MICYAAPLVLGRRVMRAGLSGAEDGPVGLASAGRFGETTDIRDRSMADRKGCGEAQLPVAGGDYCGVRFGKSWLYGTKPGGCTAAPEELAGLLAVIRLGPPLSVGAR